MRDSRQAAPDGATLRPRRATAPGDRETFFRHWLRDPLGIGAAVPSGRRVAQAMACEVELARPGVVLGLGGGPGSGACGLLAPGCPAARLGAIPRAPRL